VATDLDARFDELRESHPLLAGSLISRHNEWYDKFTGFLGSKGISQWMDDAYPNDLFPAMWKQMAAAVAEGTNLGDVRCSALFPAFCFDDAPAVASDGKLNPKGCLMKTAVVGIFDETHLVWAEQMPFGGPVPPVIVSLFARDQVRRVVPVFWGNLLTGKNHGVQFTVDEDEDGLLELLTFVMSADVIKQEWEPFQQQLMQPFST